MTTSNNYLMSQKSQMNNDRSKEPSSRASPSQEDSSFIKMRYILESQNRILAVFNEALDLGFLNRDLVRHVMILVGLLLYSESGERHDPHKMNLPLMTFIAEVRKRDELTPLLKELLSKAIQTLKIIAKMRENIQMFILLKLYRKFETSSKEMETTMSKVFQMFSLYSNIEHKYENSSLATIISSQIKAIPNCLFFETDKFDKKPEVTEEVALDYVKRIDIEISEYSKSTVSIDLILLKIIFDISRKDLETYSTSRQTNSKNLGDVEYVGGQIDSQKLDQQIRLSILDVVTDYYDQRFRILQKLLNVEIIYGEEERRIFQTLSDSSSENKPQSSEYLANRVNILLAADMRFKSSATSDVTSEYRSKIKAINDFLELINEDMKRKFDAKIDFKKTQNLLKNKGFHEHMLKLLSLRFQVSEHKELFTNMVNFFCYFCQYNTVNKKLLAPHMTSFIDLIGQGIDSARLVSTIGQVEVDPKASASHIDYIFNKINQIVAADDMQGIFNLLSARRKATGLDLRKESIRHNLQMLLSYKTILSGVIFDDKDFRRDENQRKIIFYLVNNRELVKIFEFKYFNEIKRMLAKDGDHSRHPDSLIFYEFYAGYLSLLADASWNFLGGIDQARRVLTKEQMLEVLTSPNTPLFFKKHFLKCFHHVDSTDPDFPL